MTPGDEVDVRLRTELAGESQVPEVSTYNVSTDNPITGWADVLFDTLRAGWLFVMATIFGLALVLFTWLGIADVDYFIAAAFGLLGAAAALITGSKLKA